MRGHLNLFQSAMLRWRELHPYCASHVIAIEAPWDGARARRVIAEVLEACGLTGLELDARRRRYHWHGGAASGALEVVDGEGDPFETAASVIERTINEPFPARGRFDPFRFFAVPGGGTFLLGVTYDHFIAGGDSIVVLLTDIADRYGEASSAPLAVPRLERYPATYDRLFLRQAPALVRGLTALPGLLAGWRRAIRPHLRDPSDGTNGFVHVLVDAGRYATLRSAARGLGVTTNDLILALMLSAVMPIAARRGHTGRRREVALASIVNVRGDYQPPATRTFGQFLSSFRVVHPFVENGSLADTAREIARQTGRAKRSKLYLVTLVAVGAAALLWPFATPARRHRLYIKYHPVFAGLTPLNVDMLRRRPAARDTAYLRAASTGPMSPMVVAATTAGDKLRIGVTYRTTALTRDDARTALASMLERMDTLQ